MQIGATNEHQSQQIMGMNGFGASATANNGGSKLTNQQQLLSASASAASGNFHQMPPAATIATASHAQSAPHLFGAPGTMPPPPPMPIAGLGSNSRPRTSHAPSVSSFSANFWENYEHLCALQNLMPLQALKASLSVDGGTQLNLNADKLK